MKLKNLISEDMKNDKFIEMNKMNDVEFLKIAWNMEIPELKELLQFLEDKHERDTSLYKAVKGQVKALYKNGMNFYKSRIEFVYDIINDKNAGESIPDWAIAETIIRRRLAKLTESYGAIVSLPDNDIKEYAKAAIRDIFIQMPSRSVNLNNWHGYKNYISEFFGEDSYDTAMKELQNEGWLTKGDTRYEWKHMYGPVGTTPKKDHLNEWADMVSSGELDLDNEDPGSYPFFYNIKNYSVSFGEESNTHSSVPKGNFTHKVYIPGRIWTKEKVLSVWEYPDTKAMYNAMLKKLSDEMQKNKLGKIDASWKMDIPMVAINFMGKNWTSIANDASREAKAMGFREIESYLIPIFYWTPDIMKNPSEYKKEKDTQMQQHMRSPFAKKSDVVGDIGSKKRPVDMTATQRHQMKSTSESMNEWADGIKYKGRIYGYPTKNSIAFGYVDGELKSSYETAHRFIGIDTFDDSDLTNNYAGRVFADQKAISFWGYPESKSRLQKIIKDLNNEYPDLNINSSWKIEIASELLSKKYIKYRGGKLHVKNYDAAMYSGKATKSVYIPIDKYDAGLISNAPKSKRKKKSMQLKHMLSPVAKSSDVSPGIGSKKLPAKLTTTQRHQMKSTSENIKEWADEVRYIDNGKQKKLSAIDKDAIPFIYRIESQKTYFAEFGQFHDRIQTIRIYSKKGGSISGRVWVNEKIISLWDYTDTKQQFLDMIDSINKYNDKNIKINSSWKIDIPKVTWDYYEDSMKWLRDDDYEESYFIPVFDWKPNIMKNPSLYYDALNKRKELHTLSPMAKKPDVYTGVGSKKRTSTLSPAQQYQLTHTSENKINEIQTEFGCLMLKLEFPWWKNYVEKYVKEEDIYNNAQQDFGYEFEPHVTILYGFSEAVDVERIKKMLNTLKRPISIKLTKIDIFSTKMFDVVKFDVQSKMLNKLNEIVRQNFEYTETHKDYKPHVTIAYVKPGEGEKYVSNLKMPILTSSSIFMYSYPGGKKETFNVLKNE